MGGEGADVLIGATGSDTASYFGVRGLIVSLADPGKNTGHALGDTYVSIENLSGTRTADILEGDGRANILDGGAARDTLTGGGGADTFRFGFRYDSSYDTVTDFVAGLDKIAMRHEQYTALAEGSIASSIFAANTSGTAATAQHHIIYETDTGRLRYDADGSGEKAAVIFAVLTPNLAITHEDFFVY